MSPSDSVSPLFFLSHSPRSAGTLLSTACRSTTWSPSTTPRCGPPCPSNATIFMIFPQTTDGTDLGAGTIEHPPPQREGRHRANDVGVIAAGEPNLTYVPFSGTLCNCDQELCRQAHRSTVCRLFGQNS